MTKKAFRPTAYLIIHASNPIVNMTSVFGFRQNPQFWYPISHSPPTKAIHTGQLQTSNTLPTNGWRTFYLTATHIYQGLSESPVACCEFKVDLRWVTLKPFEERTNNGIRFGFSLVTATKKEDLYANSQEDLNVWLDQLEQICILRDITDDFTLSNQIGSGGQSEVFRGESIRTGVEMAIKHFDKRRFINHPKKLEALAKEIDILRRISHPRILQLLNVYEDDQAVYLVTELIPGKTLYDDLRTHGIFAVLEAEIFITNFLDLLVYLARQGILHRDIKPENIMIPDCTARGDFKLIDFGFATQWTGVQIDASCGSPGYMAPEIIWTRSHGDTLDVYSAGMVFYVLIAGCSPFFATRRSEVIRLNAENDVTFGQQWTAAKGKFRGLIKDMTCTDPSLRKTAVEHKSALLGAKSEQPMTEKAASTET